jgi:hypothetical protein
MSKLSEARKTLLQVMSFNFVPHGGELLCNLSITGMRRTFGQSKANKNADRSDGTGTQTRKYIPV